MFIFINVLNFRQGDISVFSWHHLFLFSPIYQCVTFHALATAIAFRRTSKAAKVRSLHTFHYVLVGCNKPEIKELSPFLTKKHWWRPLRTSVFDSVSFICVYLNHCHTTFISLSWFLHDSNFLERYQIANQLNPKVCRKHGK